MSYRYETHMHTSEGSRCGKSTAAEMIRSYKEQGYTGVFVTDHFFNGNCAVDRSLSWEEKVELFCKGYENAKAEGDAIGVDVFFGFEYAVSGAEFLIYNLDKEWLLQHPDIDKTDAREAFRQIHEDGGFIIHAHPFRERDYIDHIHLYPRDVDGVEIYNGAQRSDEFMNERAKLYAMMYELPATAGSDSHSYKDVFRCSVLTEERITEPMDYLHAIFSGELQIEEQIS